MILVIDFGAPPNGRQYLLTLAKLAQLSQEGTRVYHEVPGSIPTLGNIFATSALFSWQNVIKMKLITLPEQVFTTFFIIREWHSKVVTGCQRNCGKEMFSVVCVCPWGVPCNHYP